MFPELPLVPVPVFPVPVFPVPVFPVVPELLGDPEFPVFPLLPFASACRLQAAWHPLIQLEMTSPAGTFELLQTSASLPPAE